MADLIDQGLEAHADAGSAEGLRHALDDMKRMLDSLFDVSRLNSGATQPEITVFPLPPLLEQIIIAYRQIADSKGVPLVVVPTDAVVRSDRVLLGRMLSNLIENAVRYTHSGQVTMKSQPAGTYLVSPSRIQALAFPNRTCRASGRSSSSCTIRSEIGGKASVWAWPSSGDCRRCSTIRSKSPRNPVEDRASS